MKEPLGYRLKLLRAERGFTLQEVEALTGLAHSTVSHIECGRIARPRAVTLAKLARAYRVPASGLIEPEPAKQPDHACVVTEVA